VREAAAQIRLRRQVRQTALRAATFGCPDGGCPAAP